MDTALPIPDLTTVSDLYESARFMDLWRLTQPLWHDRSLVQRLTVDELIMASRAASRLGSSRWYRALLRAAVDREPQNQRVRYYAGGLARRSTSLFDLLRDLEDNTPDRFDDPTLEASWRSSHAVMLARVRDFDRAHDQLKRAHDCGRDDGYVFCNQSRVFLIEDRWDEALSTAQASWAASPGQPYAADALHQSLSALGREHEALDFLLEHIRNGGQSGDCVAIALSAAFGVAGRMDEDERPAFMAEMMQVTQKLDDLFPLADRHSVRSANHARLYAAFLARDWDRLRQLSPVADVPFFNALTKNLAQNPAGVRKLVPHKPIRQRHNTCLPASLAVVAGSAGVDIDQDAVADAISFEGTVHWRARDFGEEQGFVVRTFCFDVATAKSLIDHGISFLISFTYLKSGHACAFVGYDEAVGTALIHDPSTGQLSEMLIDRVAEGEAPLGPICMLFLSPEQAERIAGLELPGEHAERDVHEVHKALATQGAATAQKLAAGMTGETPQARFMQAFANSLAGEYGQSTEEFLRLLNEFPQCVRLQRQVLSSVGALGDTTRLRKTLHKIVTRAPLPGVEGSRDWIYPEPHLLSRYAAELMQNARLHKEAHRWLRRALLRGPLEGEVYFDLGNLLRIQNKAESALLPFRFAALLDSGSEYTSEAYTNELHQQGRTEEGIKWLHERVKKYGTGIGGTGPWITLIERLEHFGRPEEALDELRKARKLRPEDGELASFATSFFGFFGREDEAESALVDANRFGRSADKYLAQIKRHIANGRLEAALDTAETWRAESPQSRVPCDQVLRLREGLSGPEAALALAEEWHRQSPQHDMFEELLLGRLTGTSRAAERVPLLQARVKRNPHDAWAWRELAIELESAASISKGQQHTRKLSSFEKVVRRCGSVSPEHPVTLQLQAELAWLQGKADQAIDFAARSFEADSFRVEALARGLDFARGQRNKALALLPRFRDALARQRTQLEQAPEAASLIASHFGRAIAEGEILGWSKSAPGDPWLVQARAELLIDRGGGIDALGPFVPELEEAVRRYPIHPGLRYCLANCYFAMLRYDDVVATLNELLSISPSYMSAYTALADVLQRLERPDEAEQILRRAVARNPLHAGTHHALVDFLQACGLHTQATEALSEACTRIPNNMTLWERRIGLLLQANDLNAADQVSRELAELYKDGAYAQLIRAQAMRELKGLATRQQVDEAYRRAMDLNTEFFDVVDEYADFLCDQGQFSVARKMLLERRSCFSDPVNIDFKVIEVDRRARPGREHSTRLAGLLRSRPDFAPGWRAYFAWVEEDGGAEHVRTTVNHLPANLDEDVSLQCDKLALLLATGEPFERISNDWSQLISNFPDSMEVNLRWFEILLDRRMYQQADDVLQVYAQHGADAPQVLARQVALACLRKDRDAALEFSGRLWMHTGGEAGRSAYYAFNALKDSRFLSQAITQVFNMRETGVRIMRSAVMIAVDFTPNIKSLHSLLASAATEGDLELVGVVLGRLIDLHDHGHVLRFARSHADICQSNTGAWCAVGWAHFEAKRFQAAANWLSDWRQRADVELSNVFACVCANLDSGRFETAWRDGVDGLETLNHDNTAPILVRNTLLGCWLAGNVSEFELQFSRFGHLLLNDQESGPTIRAMNCALRLLQCEEAKELKRLDKEVKAIAQSGALVLPKPFMKTWDRVLLPKLTWWQRAIRAADIRLT